ncbi:MAG: hypothetical protein AB7G17_05725 [Phycisphaerales bacterium]
MSPAGGPSTSADTLLRRLGAVSRGVTPGGASGAPVGGASFETLLEQARAGRVETGRDVRLGDGVRVALSDAQMRRVSAAVDAAEASGAVRALVIVDGNALTVDVGSRTILGCCDAHSAGVIAGVDAVVTTGPAEEGDVVSAAPLSLGRLPANAGLVRALGA